MTAIYFENSDCVTLTAADFDRIRRAADDSPLRRARYCLHRDTADPLHEMIIALREDTYVHPHRHCDRSESFHLIEGELLVVFFDDRGTVTRRLRLGPPGGALPFVCRVNCSWWHTAIPLTRYVIVHETTLGPFDPAASPKAPWAPSADDPAAVAAFLRSLRTVS